MLKKTRMIICGESGHGKDTVSGIIANLYNVSFASSSHTACELAVFPYLKDIYGYKTWQECYADKDRHRPEAYRLIKAFNTPNLTRLADIIFSANDIYCGMRNPEELAANKEKHGDNLITIFVDAKLRKPNFHRSSNGIIPGDCDYVLDNNGTRPQLLYNLSNLLALINTQQKKRITW